MPRFTVDPEQMKRIENSRFGEERALYGSRGVRLAGCAFDGAEDGESALKESSDIVVEDTFCNLRYPFWHDKRLLLRRCEMTELCRAALWYTTDAEIDDCRMRGIKALRECERIELNGCDIVSPEFGWSVRGITMRNCRAESEYFLMRSEEIRLEDTTLKGKYSFQYVQGGEAERCVLQTKDAFWHAKHVTVRDSEVKGEYLGWYSEDLTFIRCKISGTQPFCYCKGLTLIDCEMTETDLAFEKSEVTASVTTKIGSIKNPAKGRIRAPEIGEIIIDAPTECRIEETGK